MTTFNRALLVPALTVTLAFPVFAQSGANRAGTGIPAPKPSHYSIVETKAVKDCRLHCGAMAGTPNGKNLPTAAETAARADKCQRKMLG